MAEHNCSSHQLKVVVSLDGTKLRRKQHSNLIAALLRQIADYTDGWCSTEYAKDVNLTPGQSMVFYFTSDEKRQLFKTRIGIYLEENIFDALTASSV